MGARPQGQGPPVRGTRRRQIARREGRLPKGRQADEGRDVAWRRGREHSRGARAYPELGERQNGLRRQSVRAEHDAVENRSEPRRRKRIPFA